jgi:ankyrin repeat protein
MVLTQHYSPPKKIHTEQAIHLDAAAMKPIVAVLNYLLNTLEKLPPEEFSHFVKGPNTIGNTPLHCAASRAGCLANIAAILKMGANIMHKMFIKKHLHM